MRLFLHIWPLLLFLASCQKQQHAFKIEYWENGKMRIVANYRNNVYHGKVYEWDQTGTMYRMGNYENGQEQGLQTLYYPNGKIRARYEVINGRKYGFPGTKNCRNVKDSIH